MSVHCRLLCLFGALFASSEVDAANWRCDRSPLVVTNARVWNDGKPVQYREIVVVDGRITELGPVGRLRRPSNSRIINARGAWLLPGLIDSHAHFGRASLLSADLLPKPYPPSWSVTGAQTIASGVTTVKIHYADLERAPKLAAQSADDCDPSPRVILGASGLLGGRPSEGSWLPQVSSPEEAREQIRRNAAGGAQWVELHDTERFTPEELAAIADEARRSGIKLMASGASVAEAEAGVALGARAIDHFDASASPEIPASLVSRIKRRGIFVVAPIGFFTRYNAYRSNPHAIDRDAWLVRRFDAPSVSAALIAGTRDRFVHPPASEQTLVDNFSAQQAKFRQLLKSGVKLVVGSDSGSQGNFHGDAIWWELRAWRDNGAPTARLIAAATSVPAQMLGTPDRGTLSIGSRADFVLYEGDLAKGELEVSRVSTVAKGGVVYLRDGKWVGPALPATD